MATVVYSNEEDMCSSVIMVSVPMTFIKVGKNEFQVIYDELITSIKRF